MTRVERVGVTGADGQVGRQVQKSLADRGADVRALARADDWSVLRDRDAIIHLAGTLQPRRPNTYRRANVETTRRMLEGARNDARIVFLSFLGADRSSRNAYLRSKGEAEELILSSGRPATVFRSSHIYGTCDHPGPTAASFMPRRGNRVSILGDGSQRFAPVSVLDIAEMLASAALSPAHRTGTFEVGGPAVVTADGFARLVNDEPIVVHHVPAALATTLARVLPSLTSALVEVMMHDAIPAGDWIDVAGTFGVHLTPFDDAWR